MATMKTDKQRIRELTAHVERLEEALCELDGTLHYATDEYFKTHAVPSLAVRSSGPLRGVYERVRRRNRV